MYLSYPQFYNIAVQIVGVILKTVLPDITYMYDCVPSGLLIQ